MVDSEVDDRTATAKSVAMCVLFAASMSLGSLPIFLSKLLKWNSEVKQKTFVQMLLCFGGGVLICTTFLHLLPEVSDRIEDLQYIPKNQIHYAELLMCMGFFTMYFAEECVHLYLHYKRKNQKNQNTEAVLSRSLSIRRLDTQEEKSGFSATTSLEAPITICAENKKNDNHHHHHHDHSHFDDGLQDSSTIKAIRGLLIVMALSIHELFEGLAVGLESSSTNVWYMFGAVSAHKLVIAFCIGVELVTSGMKSCLVIIYVFTFAVVSPLGIGIGILISKGDKSQTDLPSVMLQGLSSGTLLYVVFFEILRTERKSGLKQFSSVFVGFFVMLSITFLK